MPLTGDLIWKVDDISLALGGVEELVQKFIEKHKHTDYSLSIFDSQTNQTIEIDCGIDEMSIIVDYVYHLENEITGTRERMIPSIKGGTNHEKIIFFSHGDRVIHSNDTGNLAQYSR